MNFNQCVQRWNLDSLYSARFVRISEIEMQITQDFCDVFIFIAYIWCWVSRGNNQCFNSMSATRSIFQSPAYISGNNFRWRRGKPWEKPPWVCCKFGVFFPVFMWKKKCSAFQLEDRNHCGTVANLDVLQKLMNRRYIWIKTQKLMLFGHSVTKNSLGCLCDTSYIY